MSVFNAYNFKVIHELEIDGVKEEDNDDFSLDSNEEDSQQEENQESEPAEENVPNAEDEDFDLADETEEDFSLEDESEETSTEDETPIPDTEGEESIEGENEADDDFSLEDEEGDSGENVDDGESDISNNTDDDFSLDTGDGQGEEGETEEGSEGDNATNNLALNNASSPESELEALDNEIFASLSPQQRAIQSHELKGKMANIYTVADEIIDRINKVTKSTNNIEVVDKVITSLQNIKKLVSFYVENTFDTKSYTENSIIYKKYLVCLKVINNILKDIEFKGEEDTKK